MNKQNAIGNMFPWKPIKRVGQKRYQEVVTILGFLCLSLNPDILVKGLPLTLP